ncbi:hypothetical protein MYY11_002669 [Enterococcus faecium]|nr:hypothetical protein [Enterococcus faecium]
MKKALTVAIVYILCVPMLLTKSMHTDNVVHAESTKAQQNIPQETKEKAEDRNGLLGYYYKGNNFNDLTLLAPTRNNTLLYNQETANQLLNPNKQIYQSIKWTGFIKSKETGNFTFSLSDDQQEIIEINGKVVSKNGEGKQPVSLEKGQLAAITIFYSPTTQLNLESKQSKELKLIKTNEEKQSLPVQQEELFNPNFRDTKSFQQARIDEHKVMDIDEDTDTDGDAIPDLWEQNGYTIKNKVAVKWYDALADDGYIKFMSNPLESHTVGDPYTDYEKAARDLPLANAKETYNPLVAAFPSVNVSMEKIILSKDENLSNSVGSNSSNNWTYTNTEGASVEAGGGPLGLSFGVSANYEHSETVGVEWGHSTEDTSQFNTATAGYLNANVRYNNVGTGAIYDVKPTTNFVLDDVTIATIKAKDNTSALSLTPSESYPKKGQNGIALTTIDDFNSHPLTLNKQQLDQLLANEPLILQTTQTDGIYKIKDVNGNIVDGDRWAGVADQIHEKTASIMVDTGESVSEKRVAAKDYQYPEDKTPSLTLKEALKLAYPEINEKDGLLYYNDQPIYESSVMTYLDKNTANEVKSQLNATSGPFKDVHKLYDVKLTPKMNFTIKLATLYDGGEVPHALGNWYYTYNPFGGDANTGTKYYHSAHTEASLVLDSNAKSKLAKNRNYYISLYMKPEADTDPTIIVKGERANIISKKVQLSSKGFQRIDILVSNMERNPINQLFIVGDGNTDISWDDVSFTEVGAMTPENYTDKDIQTIYSDYFFDYGWSNTVNAIWFKNITPLQNYIKKYHVTVKSPNGIIEIDDTRDTYPPKKDGSVKIHLVDYNSGYGVTVGYTVEIEAIGADGRVIPLLPITLR